MNNKEKYVKALIVVVIIFIVSYFVVPSIAYTSDSYAGEYIVASKVYMNDGSLNLVVYFNETPTAYYLIFEDWEARHSVLLSNINAGERIEISYRDYVFGVRTIVEIEIL